MLFGFSAGVYDKADNTNLSAGDQTIAMTTVPAGEIWVITNLAFEYTGTPPTDCTMRLSSGGVAHDIFNVLTPASGQWYDRQGWWFLSSGTFVACRVVGATAFDDLRLRATGFSIDIDQ